MPYGVSVLLSESDIRTRVREMGQQITEDYRGRKPLLIGALTGSFVFMADLCREIDLDVEIAFLKISSYGSRTETSGKVLLVQNLTVDIKGRDVIIVEDIVDSGFSLDFLLRHVAEMQPASVKSATLLNKPEAHRVSCGIDYVGFDIPDDFVIGYGLDFAESKRNLKQIYTVTNTSE